MSICIASKTICVGYLRLWPPSCKFTSPVRPFRNKPACNRSTCVEEVNTNACKKHTKAIKHDTNEIQVDCQQFAMHKRHPWQTQNLRGTVITATYESIRRDNLWLIFDGKASLISHHDFRNADVSLLKWHYDKDEDHEEESSTAATTAFALARPVEGRYDTETWNAQSSEGRSGCSHGFSSNHSYMRVKVQGERMFEVWRTFEEPKNNHISCSMHFLRVRHCSSRVII